MNNVMTLESYLSGYYQPLYHFTDAILSIMRSDMLRRSHASKGATCVCVTRDKGFISWGGSDTRITLDTNLLRKNGYVPIPIDELMHSRSNNGEWSNKSNPNGRYINHNVDVNAKATNLFPVEAEERFLTDINLLGIYVTHIDVKKLHGELERSLSNYIKKYPHIVVRQLIETDNKAGISYWKEPTTVLLGATETAFLPTVKDLKAKYTSR